LVSGHSGTAFAASIDGDGNAQKVGDQSKPASDAQVGVGSEIVVTANRREESIQKVPISISAVSGNALADSKVANVNDLGQVIPSIQIRNQFGGASPQTFIRGVGNASFVTTSVSPVGFYVDGIYIGQNIAQGLQLFDIERVEVLRGPQGTLFGRNTTGGLLNVVTRKPRLNADINGEFNVTVGDYGTFNADGALGGPISSTLAYRLAFTRQSDNGVFRSVNPNFVNDSNIGAIDSMAARGQFLWEPTAPLTVLFNGHWGRSSGGLVANKPGFLDSATVTNCPPGAISGAVGNGCTDPFGFGVRDTPGFHDTTSGTPGYERVNAYGGSVEVNYDLSGYTLTSVTAWDKADLNRLHDSEGHELSFLNSTFLADAQYWSQELRISSPVGGALNWVAGLYYYGDRNETFAHYGSGDLFGSGIAQKMRLKTESFAAFADGVFEIASGLKITAGARWTSDERRAEIETWATNSLGLVSPPAVPPSIIPAVSASGAVDEALATAAFLAPLIPFTKLKKTWKKWSGRASLSYSIDDRNLVYGTWSYGFKGGEFNGSAIISPDEVGISDPEYVSNYEIGYKASAYDGAVRANISAFYMNYKNQQVQSYVTAASVFPALTNAGASRIKGVEFDTQVRLGFDWLFSLSGSYLDAEFTQLFDPVLGDRSGNRLPSAPKGTLNGMVRHQKDIGSGTLITQANVRWNSNLFFTVENEPGLKQPAYAVVDARISYNFLRNSAEVGLFAKNLLDKKFFVSGYDLRAFGSNTLQVGRPRVIGVDASFEF